MKFSEYIIVGCILGIDPLYLDGNWQKNFSLQPLGWLYFEVIDMLRIIKHYIMKWCWRNYCKLGKGAVVDRNAFFEGKNLIRENTKILNTHLGYATYVGENCFLKNTKIGKYTCIADNVRTISGTHPTSDFVSMHPVFYSKMTAVGFTYADENCFEEYRWVDEEKRITIMIGNDVWLGDGVRIVDGVVIGDGAIVGAGAVVVKDVPPYAIVGGVPARIIRYRFQKEQIKRLLEIAWWDQDGTWIKAHAVEFKNIENFLQEQR